MIRDLGQLRPEVASSAFVADTALVIGDVVLGDDSSIWYGTIVRGDVNSIRIGSATNIQDRCVVHVTRDKHPTSIGDGVTIGHGAIVHGCAVGDNTLVGMGSLVLDGVHIGSGSVVAAGSLLPPGKTYPEGSLIVGNPARIVRSISSGEREWIRSSAESYIELAKRHRELDA